MENRTSDAAVQCELQFRKGCDAAFVKAAEDSADRELRKAWRKMTARARRKFNRRFAGDSCVTLWSAESMVRSSADRELAATIEAWQRSPRPGKSRRSVKAAQEATAEIAELLASAVQQEPTAYSILTAAEMLLRQPEAFSPEAFAALWRLLAATDTSQWNHVALPGEPETSDAVARTVTNGELPFVLGLLMSPLKQAKLWLQQGRESLQRTLSDATETDGMLHASITGHIGEWFAPLVRASAWADSFGVTWCGKRDARRWKDTIRHASLLAASGGIITELAEATTARDSTAAGDSEVTVCILEHAAALSELGTTSPAAMLLAASAKPSSAKSRHTRKDRGRAGRKNSSKANSNQSDWAALAVLRSGMHIDDDLAVLSWDQTVPKLSLSALGIPFLAGPWSYSMNLGTQAPEVAAEWACSCWFQDRDVAFVELTCDITNGMQAVRHVMLSKQEHFAIVCESVSCPDPSMEFRFESRMRLPPDRTVESDPVTRELLLHGDGVTIRAVPAWLDDDRVFSAPGEFVQDNDDLVLTAEGAGGVTLPVVFDWHPKRRIREADWNRLTVTENRVPQSAQQAAGFRVRIGRLQLLLYRSLRAGETLRAVLGHHTNNETVYGHVRNSGEIDMLVLVDGEAEE
ncbi:MAG: hypothetical protein R3C19_09390 [Planctomycetaceae bacterium]